MEGKWAPQIGKENKYQYNGKELDNEFGLNWYHYGFRMYDPAIARFPSADPIAENFPHVSSYNYAENKPINSIDLWGLQSYPMYSSSHEGLLGNAEDFRNKNPKTAGVIAAAPIIIMTGGLALEAYGVQGSVALILNEVKDEVLSQATGGLSDVFDITKAGFKILKNISDINKIGGEINCEGCARATDANLKGNPASALGDEFASIHNVNSNLAKDFGPAKIHSKFSGVMKQLENLGEGSTAIVTTTGTGKKHGHAFNVANVDGKIRVFDGQFKTEISKDQLSQYLKQANPSGFSFNVFNTTNK